MTRLLLSFCVVCSAVPAFARKEQRDPAELRRKVDEFLEKNPAIARDIRAGNTARENLEWMFRVGEAKRGEAKRGEAKNPRGDDAALARAERAIKIALEVMTETKRLEQQQAKDLYKMVFPGGVDWEARYAAYLRENPAVASAVKSGKITKEKVMAGIKAREGERPPTREEQIEALYQKLIKEDRTLGRTPKARLMARLKEMFERGEGKNLRPEKTTRQRRMTFGLYFNDLIESGQVERFDKDLKRVHDVGSTEILRQGGRRDERAERERGADRGRAERKRGRRKRGS